MFSPSVSFVFFSAVGTEDAFPLSDFYLFHFLPLSYAVGCLFPQRSGGAFLTSTICLLFEFPFFLLLFRRLQGGKPPYCSISCAFFSRRRHAGTYFPSVIIKIFSYLMCLLVLRRRHGGCFSPQWFLLFSFLSFMFQSYAVGRQIFLVKICNLS